MKGRGGETTVQMLGRLLDEALEALAGLPDHVSTRSGYCAKCEGGCFASEPSIPAPLVPHPWDAIAERERNVEAAQTYSRSQRWTAFIGSQRQ